MNRFTKRRELSGETIREKRRIREEEEEGETKRRELSGGTSRETTRRREEEEEEGGENFRVRGKKKNKKIIR